MAEIRPIEEESRRQIAAGQAIEDLASAVKELVDNALDAKSKSINIRLFNQGIDIVEVSDDGCGVPQTSRAFMATPHATSKIRSFDEIYKGSSPLTMGFRGEALFCLANLSANLVAATRTENEPLAQKLEFGRDGSLNMDSVTSIPRKVGTTVAVIRLLEAVPVRRADMIRRIQSQRARLVKMMEGYCIFSVGVRLNLMDMITTPGGGCRESTLIATTANSTSIQETVSSVLGSKFLANLSSISIDLSLVVEKDKDEEKTHGGKNSQWKLEGLISKALSQHERGTPHRQYFAINGRPVDLPKVSRLLNDIWRSFGGKKRPSCVLQLTLPNSAFDVNLSPSKREVMFTNEKEILDRIQEGVTQLWSSQTEGKFETASMKKQAAVSQVQDDESGEDDDDEDPSSRFNRRYAFAHDFSKAKLQHEYDDGRRRSGDVEPASMTEEQQEARKRSLDNASAHSEEKKHDGPSASGTRTEESSEVASDNRSNPVTERKRPRLDVSDHSQDAASIEPNTVTPSSHQKNNLPGPNETRTVGVSAGGSEEGRPSRADRSPESELRQFRAAQRRFNTSAETAQEEEIEYVGKSTGFDRFRADAPVRSTGRQTTPSVKSYNLERFGFRSSAKKVSLSNSSSQSNEDVAQETRPTETQPQFDTASSNDSVPAARSTSISSSTEKADETATSDEPATEAPSVPNRQPLPTVVWDAFRGTDDVIRASRQERLGMRKRKRTFQGMRREQPCISQGEEDGNSRGGERHDEVANSDLSNSISLRKDDFKNMTVVGQFNMGFILALSQDNHLWILDQHACDEKYNFEKLCAETVIHEQKLIAPMPLELSPSEETCVMDHMDIFEKNGFRFKYDESKPPRHRLSLTALPHSGARDGRKAVQFGKEDVSALCTILGADSSASVYDGATGGGTGADGSGMYGNNAVRRYVSKGDTADKIIARLPKAIAMFASRACRGSIMIGKALSHKEMDRVVKRLADVEHPWNCPHGRPTMRHVGDLRSFVLDDERMAAEHVAGPTVTMMTQDENEEVED